MQTKHSIIFQDSRELSAINDQSIDLVVTSPPYPMIEMWDEQFIKMDPAIALFLENGEYGRTFESMHLLLDEVWQELYRVMKEGALACINIGDATRTINSRFQLFANHARIQRKFFDLGFDILPLILWRKQTTAPNKFMGSGMLPAGAYVTLEHEYILIFRKGNKRIFASAEEKQNRLTSAFFWEERNTWFSDLWDFKGARQEINNRQLRSRSAAYPVILPFRLINMYSVFGDAVLDPFSGTGTTSLAAMAAGRDSIGFEVDSSFSDLVKERVILDLPALKKYNADRINNHLDFVRRRMKEKGELKYINSYFGFPVMTRQEKDLRLVFIKSVLEMENNCFTVSYCEDQSVKNFNLDELSPEQLDVDGQIQINFIP